MMRIVFVGPVPPLLGGISQHSARLVDALRSQGHTVQVLSWKSQYPWLLYRSPQREPNGTAYPGADFLLRWWSIPSWSRARRFARSADLVVFPYVTPFLAVPQRFITARAKRVVAMVHNALPHEKMPFQNGLARLAMNRAHLLVAHGRGVADDLRSIGIQTQVSIVPMPPTLQVEPTPMPRPPPWRLLFFGFVRQYKGLAVAIDSISELTSSGHDVTLTVVGEFWEPVEPFQEQVARLGLSDEVDLRPGYVSDPELNRLLATHQVVVAPYLESTMSAVIPVAFAAGRPVVSTHVRGISEQVTDKVNGILVTPGDSRALADGVVTAMELLAELGEGALSSATSWATVADALTTSETGTELASETS